MIHKLFTFREHLHDTLHKIRTVKSRMLRTRSSEDFTIYITTNKRRVSIIGITMTEQVDTSIRNSNDILEYTFIEHNNPYIVHNSFVPNFY